MAAMIGSDAGQTRWALMFVISTVIFYELALNRKEDIEEHHASIGGKVPGWVRYLTLIVTIAALIGTFWVSVGRHSGMLIRAREYMHGISSTPGQHARDAKSTPAGLELPPRPAGAGRN